MVTIGIDVLDEDTIRELERYFDVAVRGRSPAYLDVYVTGDPKRIRGWLDLNCYEDVEELYPELF